jgi:hypothetical protein
MARPEGTVDMPRRHRDTLTRLVLAWMLWRMTWHCSVVLSWLVSSVRAMVLVGGRV